MQVVQVYLPEPLPSVQRGIDFSPPSGVQHEWIT